MKLTTKQRKSLNAYFLIILLGVIFLFLDILDGKHFLILFIVLTMLQAGFFIAWHLNKKK